VNDELMGVCGEPPWPILRQFQSTGLEELGGLYKPQQLLDSAQNQTQHFRDVNPSTMTFAKLSALGLIHTDAAFCVIFRDRRLVSEASELFWSPSPDITPIS
jgi:hypothetical protein